jgi:hypothetical protein
MMLSPDDHDERELDVLYVSPERFCRTPQIGVACRMTWRTLALYLSRPTIGAAKHVAGAWSPALYRQNVRRKSNLIQACAIVVDVDERGDVERVASVLARYCAIVHSTFSATAEKPRCRIILALAAPIDAQRYDATHAVVRSHLAAVGILADEGAKDASRLSYSPVVRPGAPYHYCALHGSPLDARDVLAAQPFVFAPLVHQRGSNQAADHRPRVNVQRAASAVAQAREGSRHATLYRKAFALGRVSEASVVEAALLPSALRAGLPESEASRAIRDAVRAARGQHGN